MTEQQDATPKDRDKPPALASDIRVEKSLRFGCGALLATLVVASAVVSGGFQSAPLALLVGVIAALSCGLLAVLRGDAFLERFLKLMRWL